MANEGLDLFADGFSFLELPRWHEGRLWAADMFAGQVVAFAADGAAQVVITVPEVLAGFGWMPDRLAAGCDPRRAAAAAAGRAGNRGGQPAQRRAGALQ